MKTRAPQFVATMIRACKVAAPGVLGLALLAPTSALANNVGINGGACTYVTIEAAAAAASSGDTLYVSPGTYFEDTIPLNAKDLTIISADAACSAPDPQQVTIVPNPGQRGFELVDSGLILEGLTVELAVTSLDGAIVQMEQDSTLLLNDTVFRQSTSGGDGGCIHATQSAITMIGGSELERCDATNNGGGAYLNLSTMWVFSGTSVRDGSAITGDGGGIYVGGSTAYIYGDVTGNDAEDGGGLYVTVLTGIDGRAQLSGSAAVADNVADSRGGGVFVTGSDTELATYDDARIEGNTADYGGGVYSVYDGGVFLNEDTQVLGNHATSQGGGVFTSWSDRLEFVGDGLGSIQITGNTSDGQGAGVYLSGSDLYAEFVTLQDNVATGAGGGLFLSGNVLVPGEAVLRNVRVLDNEAVRGAGIVVDETDLDMRTALDSCDPTTLPKDRFCSEIRSNVGVGATSRGGGLRVINGGTAFVGTTSFMFNLAGATGGAIAIRDDGSDVTLRNALVRNNQLNGGAAVSVEEGALEAAFTTFADNDVPVEYYAGSTGLFRRNIVWDNSNDAITTGISGSCNTTQTAAGAPAGTNNDTLDPLFDAADPRSSWKLQAASPAIDACAAGPTRDLDGQVRPSGASYDRGAFEM